MYILSIDRRPYEPKKEVKVPYWAETSQGRLVIVTKLHGAAEDGLAEAVVVKQYGPEDPYSIGYKMTALSLAKVTPLAQGETVNIANTWEVVDD